MRFPNCYALFSKIWHFLTEDRATFHADETDMCRKSCPILQISYISEFQTFFQWFLVLWLYVLDTTMNFTELPESDAVSSEQCCYSSCSIMIPRLIYSGGDLAAAITVTALLVAGISVAIHIAVFYWIYKKKFQPRMIKTDKPLRQQTKSSRSASRENIDHVGEMTYVFMCDINESSTTTSQEAGAVSKSA